MKTFKDILTKAASKASKKSRENRFIGTVEDIEYTPPKKKKEKKS